MERINKLTGLNVGIVHSYRDQLKATYPYLWKCNGKCQTMANYFYGIF